MGFFSSCGGKLRVPLELRRVSRGASWVGKKESSLLSSFEVDLRIPLESLQVNQASSRVERENLVVFLQLQREARVYSQIAMSISGNLSSWIREVMPPLELWGGIRDSSCVTAGQSGLISNWGRKLGVSLEFRWVSQGSSQVATEISGNLSNCFSGVRPLSICEGKLRIPLKSLQRNCPSSQFGWESWVSSPVAMRISGFLSNCNRGVRPPLTLRHGTVVSSWVLKALPSFLSSWGRELAFFLELQQVSHSFYVFWVEFWSSIQITSNLP